MSLLNTIILQTRQSKGVPYASGGVDISSSTYGFPTGIALTPVLHVRVYGLDAGGVAVFQIDVSTDAFSAFNTVASWSEVGPIGATSPQGDEGSGEGETTSFPANPVNFSISARDCAGIPWGVSDAVMRVNLSSITSDHYVDYDAWFTYLNCSDGSI